jgi:two-component system, OmpR family, response regulator
MEIVPNVLVVDDDRDLRALVGEYLKRNDYNVRFAADGKQMRLILEQSRIDLVVLDLMLPGEDGLSLCRDLRGGSDLPVLMLTAKSDPFDRILGLETGADDYLSKPFEPRELLARIRNILRRAQALPPNLAARPTCRYGFAGWVLDVTQRQLTSPHQVAVTLSGAEFRLLHVFVTHPNRVLTRDQLMDLIKGREADPFDRSIDLRVSRLRLKLRDDARAPQLIKTLRNEGYIFTADVASED